MDGAVNPLRRLLTLVYNSLVDMVRLDSTQTVTVVTAVLLCRGIRHQHTGRQSLHRRPAASLELTIV